MSEITFKLMTSIGYSLVETTTSTYKMYYGSNIYLVVVKDEQELMDLISSSLPELLNKVGHPRLGGAAKWLLDIKIGS